MENKRFSYIYKKALKLTTVSRKACELDTSDMKTIEKAKVKLTEMIEEMLEIMSKNSL